MEDEVMTTDETPKVLTVEEAGRWLGIGRSAAYDCVDNVEGDDIAS